MDYKDDKGALAVAIRTITAPTHYTQEQVLKAFLAHLALDTEKSDDNDTPSSASARLRGKEYKELTEGTTNVTRDDDFECEAAKVDLTDPIPQGLDKVMLVKRLREVRALQSFTRLEMPDPEFPLSRPAALSRQESDWLPAIEVRGEGVFLRLDGDLLRAWEGSEGPLARANRMRDNHQAQLIRRAEISQDGPPKSDIRSPITPRFVLLHTLAHALINEWSLDCGYPAAALRERIYSSADMAGVLIYTATSDSAGSLGGVVGQGELHKLRKSLRTAMDRISWCSQDPPCMESEATGTDSLNLAACYACVLLPEISCETNNTFLDRALLIGTPDTPEIGFFH